MFDTKLVEITDDGFAAITRLKVDDALLAGVERLGWRLVVGSATELSGLAEAYQRAWSLRGRVGTTGRSVRVDDVTWSVAGLLGKEAGAMLAARLLAPVLALAPERRDALLGVLRAWLGENGSWDATAKATGLHRNSIRRQIGMLAELLELDLNRAQARSVLPIALQYTDELPGVPAAPAGPDSSRAGCGRRSAAPGPVDLRPAIGQVRHLMPRPAGLRQLGEQQFGPGSCRGQQPAIGGCDDAAAQEAAAVSVPEWLA